MEDKKRFGGDSPPNGDEKDVQTGESGEAVLVNTSGHVQELDRSFGLLSLCSIGIMSDNAWGAGGGSLVVS